MNNTAEKNDMPERIWASNLFDSWSTSDERWNGENTEYIRADVAKQRIRELEEFCKAVVRYAGNSGDDYLANKARKALEPPR